LPNAHVCERPRDNLKYKVASRAGLTIVPVVLWEGAPDARGPDQQLQNF